jgi:hypothetical protein
MILRTGGSGVGRGDRESRSGVDPASEGSGFGAQEIKKAERNHNKFGLPFGDLEICCDQLCLVEIPSKMRAKRMERSAASLPAPSRYRGAKIVTGCRVRGPTVSGGRVARSGGHTGDCG